MYSDPITLPRSQNKARHLPSKFKSPLILRRKGKMALENFDLFQLPNVKEKANMALKKRLRALNIFNIPGPKWSLNGPSSMNCISIFILTKFPMP